MRRPHLFFWIFATALAISAQEAKLPMVAVLPFTSRVLDSSAIDGLTSAMNSELINTGKFRVMERSQMDGILQEQGFQQSGACDGQECAVQVGKLLSVDQMVLGTIAKVGNTYTLSARLVDVQTGEVRKSLTRNSRAEVDAILTEIIPQVARDLAGPTKPDTMTPPPIAAAPPVTAPAPQPQAAPTEPEPAAARSSGSHWGWWLAGGAVVVAGGVTTAVLLMSGNSGPSTTTVHASW
jgi:TolB-like protein